MIHNETENTMQFLLSIQMIIDSLDDHGWSYSSGVNNDRAALSGCRFFEKDMPLRTDILYFVFPEDADRFPADDYCYITPCAISGTAPHICNLQRPMSEITNCVLSIFQKYHDFESELNSIFCSGGSLTELCRAGEKLFNNPMFIHDNLFALIALPKDVETSKQFQFNSETGVYHIPLAIIDEFKYDENYLKTYQYHHASIWESSMSHNGFRSIFVNLWDGSHYYGRLMINERSTALKPGQFASADYIAKYAVMIIQRDSISLNHSYLSFEDTFVNLALGREVSNLDLNTVLHVLDWKPKDRFICLRLQSKDYTLKVNPVSAVRSILSTELSCYSSFFYEQQLCIIINMTLSGLTPVDIQQRLAPQVRDNYMCGGLSNPFIGISQLSHAFRQSAIALEYATNPKSENWLISFEKCALDYLERLATEHFSPEILAAPQLLKLRALDAEKGTEYYITLREWLKNERNIPKTSEALIVHRTTLTYRLNKLRELIPMDLDDDALRLYLLFSYHLLDSNLITNQ